jgi:hypothetical protein
MQEQLIQKIEPPKSLVVDIKDTPTIKEALEGIIDTGVVFEESSEETEENNLL